MIISKCKRIYISCPRLYFLTGCIISEVITDRSNIWHIIQAQIDTMTAPNVYKNDQFCFFDHWFINWNTSKPWDYEDYRGVTANAGGGRGKPKEKKGIGGKGERM